MNMRHTQAVLWKIPLYFKGLGAGIRSFAVVVGATGLKPLCRDSGRRMNHRIEITRSAFVWPEFLGTDFYADLGGHIRAACNTRSTRTISPTTS